MGKLTISITVIIIALILGGSYYAVQYQRINMNQSEIVGVQDDFIKKVECEKYRDSILEKIYQYNQSQVPELRDSNNSGIGEPIYNLYVENKQLKEIFYSPKVNSCLYIESRRTLFKAGENAKPDVGDWNVAYEAYYLVDILTGKEIGFNKGLNFLQMVNRGEIFNTESDADKILNNYRYGNVIDYETIYYIGCSDTLNDCAIPKASGLPMDSNMICIWNYSAGNGNIPHIEMTTGSLPSIRKSGTLWDLSVLCRDSKGKIYYGQEGDERD